jgi:ATP-binding cassette subfamily B protein
MTRSDEERSDGQRPSPDDLPRALPSLARTVRLGYHAEPKLLLASLGVTVATAIPDVLVALWLKLLADGTTDGDRTAIVVAGIGLGLSAVGTWFVTVVASRVERRFRDRVGIALEAHVAKLHASVATIEHHERAEYADRLSVLRDQVFALDHLFLSLFSTLGWLLRLAFTAVLLASVHPALLVLLVFALPTIVIATWRPKLEREAEERVASRSRLARHLFVLGTSPGPGKDVRVTGTGLTLVARRRSAWDEWYAPVSATRWSSALWHAAGWTVFGAAYVAAIVFVASGLDASVGSVLLVVTAGARLSGYVGAAVGELGFLRGIWLDSSRRLTWLEDYAKSLEEAGDTAAPHVLREGIRFDHVSFTYPGTDRLVLDDVTVNLPAGSVVALVGENGAGKTTLVKLLCRMYQPTAGRILVDGVDLARIAPGEWRSTLAGAFQDFYRFELTAQSSVGVGDEPRMDDGRAVTSALARAGATDVVDGLERGLDTQLGPTWDEGVEVSFGQWQKLALARGFMRDAPLVVLLDEPTAALDAETEHALFERYAASARRGDVSNGRITVLVSHRFSTVRMADLIVMLDGARVVEAGSHDELMALGGPYSELYTIQATAYR